MAIASDIKYQHPGVLLVRFTVAILMLFHGVAKLMNGVDGIGACSRASVCRHGSRTARSSVKSLHHCW